MVFVTGGTGIVGIRILFDLLKNGTSVCALKRTKSDLSFVKKAFHFYDGQNGEELYNQINWVNGELRDVVSLRSGLEGCTEVYHAAAMVSFKKEDRDDLIEINAEGTANIVNASLASGIEKFCHISSVSTLGRGNKIELTTEESERNEEEDQSNYGLSKFYAEMEVWRAKEEGLNVVVLCPSLIIGAGRPNVSTGQFFSQVMKGMKYYGPGKNAVVDVRTISNSAIELMEKEVWGERFILSAENLSYKDIFTKIALAMDKTPPQKAASVLIMKMIGKISDILNFIGIRTFVSSENMKSARSKFSYDNGKLGRTIHVEYPTSDTSIQYFANYYKGLFQGS